jgi:cyclic beta-1,2-glucan synthetase
MKFKFTMSLESLISKASTLRTMEFERWVAQLHLMSTREPPLRGAVFSSEQLEMHAKMLSASHTLGKNCENDRLLKRLADSRRIIHRCHDLMSKVHISGTRLAPAAEWLLDNHYLIDEQIFLTQKHFPRGYSLRLPHLAEGESKELPRTYDLMLGLISHSDNQVDSETLFRYISAYQSKVHLTMGELWAVPIMLRLALVENLRRVAINVAWKHAHRDSALSWAERINKAGDKHTLALLALAEMVRENPTLSVAFVANFSQALQGSGATSSFATAWLEQRLTEQGQTIEEIIRAESQGQAADQASMAHGIASLRFVNSTEWHTVVETHSVTEQILRKDPAGIYENMDFATRDKYRHVIENFSRRFKIDEEKVARIAIDLAAASPDSKYSNVERHVGYLLIDNGKPRLLQALRGNHFSGLGICPPKNGLRLFFYLFPAILLSLAIAMYFAALSNTTPLFVRIAAMLFSLMASFQCGIQLTNWFVSLIFRPKILPRMNFEHGIPAQCRTIAVVPTFLTSLSQIDEIVNGLELRYLANRDSNLWFGLLTDFGDASQEHCANDDSLIEQASRGIAALNDKYCRGKQDGFFLFHRPRRFNPQERCWMGWERKRGKIEDFNALLCCEKFERFSHIVGDVSLLASIRYVITLDTDSGLPWGGGWRLVAAAAHPLNQPHFSPTQKILVRGYAILQPRVGVLLDSSQQSRYSRLLASDVGIDPYTRAVSDLYQDLFGEASFLGKGIYDLVAFRESLNRRFPENAVLSHDLLESCYARTGYCSDVELLENAPSRYLGDVSRRHRWVRGDWQLAPWLFGKVRDAYGMRVKANLSPLSWWKIFDNLRRTLVPLSLVILLSLGWLLISESTHWTLVVLLMLFAPDFLLSVYEVAIRPQHLQLGLHLMNAANASARRFVMVLLFITFLPFEAFVALDAAGRSLSRMIFTHKHLLEWQTAATAENNGASGFWQVLGRMWISPFVTALIALALIVTKQVSVLPWALPFLILWLFAPLVAWWLSRPLPQLPTELSHSERNFLREISRLTWRYFEVFVGPQENWLPPDNVQFAPEQRVAHRTSPTDLGMALLANLSAYDLSYISVGQLLNRTANTFDSMAQLERYQGHFLNWYDTNTRKALRPRYISSVDSGNLIGHIRTLRSGLLELLSAPVFSANAWDGLRDTLKILRKQRKPTHENCPQFAKAEQESILKLKQVQSGGLIATANSLKGLRATTILLAEALDRNLYPEASWWANALDRQVQAHFDDLVNMAPWLLLITKEPDIEIVKYIDRFDRIPSLEELHLLTEEMIHSINPSGREKLMDKIGLGYQSISLRIQHVRTLAERCLVFSDADISFLYDTRCKLLSIGYFVDDRRLDTGFYDLLASESRLASYIGIALGQIPFEHWFALGRRLTLASGSQALLSWSGSMFEYLMPLLVMPNYRETLLGQTTSAIVVRQRAYGRQRGVPWGISESCYNGTDFEGTYQYRAFGVPGLGLQRGLSEDVVVAPYATALALLVDPIGACKNLRRMAEGLFLGAFGFYEAIDFTSARNKKGERFAVVQCFMAHHHGMSLLSFSQALRGLMMQRRFLANSDFRAAIPLLQERIPKENVLIHPYPRESRISRLIPGHKAESARRVLTNPNTPFPEVHLLSNGRYHVMASAAGGGYSRWNNLDITRWRENLTSEAFGVFCYISDPVTHRTWSNSFQPTLHAGHRYEAVFTPGRIEFRRRDGQFETHTEIAVSPEDDLEVRRIRITNRSDVEHALVLTSYLEVVLAPSGADEQHRVFSNLFLRTEIMEDLNAILATRRPSSADEKNPWVFCVFNATGKQFGPCSYTTDRAQFLGRGKSVRHPTVLANCDPLPTASGSSLDSCFALRRNVLLSANCSEQIDLIIGAAPTREMAMALLLKYQDHRMADRVFELAATHSLAMLRQMTASEEDAKHYEQLAACVIFPISAFRAPVSILRRNRKNQSALWRYAISGDLPIVLLRVSSRENLSLVRDVLRAHAFWRTQGLQSDLVIWNEDTSGYRRNLYDQIERLINTATESILRDRPGGIYVRHIDDIAEDDRILIQAVARVVFRDLDGPFEQQLDRRRREVLSQRQVTSLRPRLPSPRAVAENRLPRNNLIFENDFGGFTPDAREYVVYSQPNRPTPAPWVNVIANQRIGTVVSESGSATTWYGNAQLFRLTPWSNDPVCDPSGEVLYIRDDLNGHFFTPTPWPSGGQSVCTCRHGFGYSIFERHENELESELTTFVAAEDPVKFFVLKLKNLSNQHRTLSVFAAVELVLGNSRSKHGMHITTELESLTGAIFARNRYNSEFPDTVVFFDSSETSRDFTGDQIEFLGRNGDPSHPAAMRARRLSGRLGAGLDPIIAMRVQVELAAETERKIVFVLGAGNDHAEALALTQRYRSTEGAQFALEQVWRFWEKNLGVLHAETPDASLNVLMNGWLPYQVLSCRMWGRSGFYQSGGAFGFRDQLQDCLALMHQMPDLARQHLIRCAERQFIEGDVQHWWHPPNGRGVRTSCSDDYLWLPYAVCKYVLFTGDMGILDQRISFLTSRRLRENEESYYDLPCRSDQFESLYEHCTRAIANGLKFGEHNLPLMGNGDWNDGMNRVGNRGKGESVWLGFFLHDVLIQFFTIAVRRGDDAFSERCLSAASQLEAQLESHGWDGNWYRRAYFDNGMPLGSAQNKECCIDSLPQSWATISEVGLPNHRRTALDSLWNHLVRKELKIVRLFAPPFERTTRDPGYIKGYPPGVRENGGQYTHAAVWAAWAFALAGDYEKALDIAVMLNPINHTQNSQEVERYKVEPYVLAADVYSEEPYAGRGGWTWYTGSAGWYYRFLYEVVIGMERRGDILHFRPRVPLSWKQFRIHYRYLETFFHCVFLQETNHKGDVQISLDGNIQENGELKLFNDGNEHVVEIRFSL